MIHFTFQILKLISSTGEFSQQPLQLYRAFHRFGQAKFAYGGSVLG
jgi:hypothetical protein